MAARPSSYPRPHPGAACPPFQKQLVTVAGTITGLGWAALVWDPVSARLGTTQIHDHQSEATQGQVPLLVIDARRSARRSAVGLAPRAHRPRKRSNQLVAIRAATPAASRSSSGSLTTGTTSMALPPAGSRSSTRRWTSSAR